MVGAGCGCCAAGPSARRHPGEKHRRTVRSARREDCATRAGRRKGQRHRPIARAAQPHAGKSSRLSLAAETVAADALDWQAGPFDGVLLDAPCSATGTIRRHPDIPWLKNEADLPVLTSLQQRLIDRAVELTKPGGTFVYCVCSLEPEEGQNQIETLLARDPRVMRSTISAQEVFGHAEFITTDGDLRTLPQQLPDPDPRWARTTASMPHG